MLSANPLRAHMALVFAGSLLSPLCQIEAVDQSALHSHAAWFLRLGDMRGVQAEYQPRPNHLADTTGLARQWVSFGIRVCLRTDRMGRTICKMSTTDEKTNQGD